MIGDRNMRNRKTVKKKQLKDFLMNEKNTVSIEKAISNSKKKWRK